MDIFGWNRFIGGPDRDAPPQKGASLWFQVLWDNLGGLLGANLLTFFGCLPLALGVSLGLVYENLWITLLSGGLGGALAGLFWVPMLSLSLQAFHGGTRGWLRRWRQAALTAPALAAGIGAVLGLLSGGLLLVGAFFGQMFSQAPLAVWTVLALDFFLLCLGGTLAFSWLCVRTKGAGTPPFVPLFAAPGRVCGAALGTLAWFGLGVALFPVSVPFALVLGFWPPALLTAQLMLPVLAKCFHLPDWDPDRSKSGIKRAGEIWWRRRWPAVVILTAVLVLLFWGGNQLFTAREPDLQVAVVHAQPLPDNVRGTLEHSLAALVGDRNGDGRALVQVNDYTVLFHGTPTDADLQTAGSTLLVTDVAAGVSAFYLVEDPEGFLARYGDKVNQDRAVLWADCPTLTGLDAGTWSTLEDLETDRSGQSLLAPLTVLPSRSAGEEALKLLLGGDGAR